MCGICGIAYRDAQRVPDRAALEAMTTALQHRGPDGAGLLVEPGIGLGHRRLSVIDLPTGGQPMTDRDGVASIIFNGEIYNYRELRAELESAGRTFQTQSDTEVLLQGYLHFGIAVLEKLAGMFAFAIWDRRTADLYLVRDRLGVKPIYWAEFPGAAGIAFASELSGLRAGGHAGNALNRTAICNFVALSYVPGADSAIEGVQRLEPGTYLHWNRARGHSLHQYWDLAAVWTGAHREPQSESQIVERFTELLDSAVRRRLVADVPLGALLSGGIDSSTICALAVKEKKHLVTFSAGFEQGEFNELPYARAMAQALGTEHHEEMVSCDSPELLLEVAGFLDEPFADTSVLPTYALCRATRKHVTVALSGDGGDELLAGYTTHVADKLHGRLRPLPASLWRMAARMASLLPEPRSKVGTIFKLKQFLRGATLDPARAHASWRMLAMPDALRELFQPGFWSDDTDPFAPALAAYNEVPELNPLDRNLYVDYKTWLADDILVKADRASMAHGLEVRSPFLDHTLIAYCAGLPPNLKLRGSRGKYLLSQTAGPLVPPTIIKRPKRGFNAPVSHWIAGPWRELVRDTLNARALQQGGILAGAGVERLVQQHFSGGRDHGFLLFTLVTLTLWINGHRPSAFHAAT